MREQFDKWLVKADEFYQREAVDPFDRSSADYSSKLEAFMGRHGVIAMSVDEYRQKFDELADDYLLYAFDPAFFRVTAVNITAFTALEIEKLQPRRVLDAGCGNGFDAIFMAEQFPQVEFIASDLSPRMTAFGESWRRRLKLDNLRFLESAHEDLSAEKIGGEVDLCFNHCGLFFTGPMELGRRLYGLSKALRLRGELIVVMSYDDYISRVQYVGGFVGFSGIQKVFMMSFDYHRAQFSLGTFIKLKNVLAESLGPQLMVLQQDQLR